MAGTLACLSSRRFGWIDRNISALHSGLASMSESNGDDSIQLDSRNAAYVEGLLEEYLKDPASVPTVWQNYFRGLADGNGEELGTPRGPKLKPTSVFNPTGQALPPREAEQSAQ